MSVRQEFQKIVKRAKELGYPDSALLITAFLSEKFGDFIVVGGFATSLHCLGAYRTMDVDVVYAGGLEKLEESLMRLGFKRNRVWCHEEADYALDIVPPSEPGRTLTFEIGGYKVRVASPEDTIINDLAGYKFWEDRSLLDRAVLVFRAQKDRLDIKYMRRRARGRGVADVLEELVRRARYKPK